MPNQEWIYQDNKNDLRAQFEEIRGEARDGSEDRHRVRVKQNGGRFATWSREDWESFKAGIDDLFEANDPESDD